MTRQEVVPRIPICMCFVLSCLLAVHGCQSKVPPAGSVDLKPNRTPDRVLYEAGFKRLYIDMSLAEVEDVLGSSVLGSWDGLQKSSIKPHPDLGAVGNVHHWYGKGNEVTAVFHDANNKSMIILAFKGWSDDGIQAIDSVQYSETGR